MLFRVVCAKEIYRYVDFISIEYYIQSVLSGACRLHRSFIRVRFQDNWSFTFHGEFVSFFSRAYVCLQ
jgi:hypothetical protein